MIGGASDDALVARAAAGQREAFEERVRRPRGRVHALALRICRNADDAEDVLQETFIAAHRALPRFDRRARFSTWLYRIATNKCYDALGRRQATLDADALPEAADPRDPYAGSERSALLELALAGLPGLFREAALLCDVCGLTPAEAGEALGVAEGTMKSRSFRARAQLARALREAGAEPQGGSEV